MNRIITPKEANEWADKVWADCVKQAYAEHEPVAWIGLTQDEQDEVFKTFSKADAYKRNFLNRVANAIEAKLKEKNT